MKKITSVYIQIGMLALSVCGIAETTASAQYLTDYGAVPKLTQPQSDQAAANQKLDFHADLFTGRFNYRIPIEVPPGRQGSEPAIALQYNSSGGNGWCGVGWDLDMGYVQRETRYGVPVNTSGGYKDTFVYSVAGQSGRLVLATDGTYRPEINTAFLKFVYSGGIWVVTDKSGRQYTFGDSTASRIANTHGTFKWALSQIVDPNGNTTTMTYHSVDSSPQLYLQQIAYNANANSPSLSANCTVSFDLDSSARSDITSSCLSATEIDTTRLLQNITVSCNGSQVRQYVLQYEYSSSTKRSLLKYVSEYGTDNSSYWPMLTLYYSAQTNGFSSPVPWAITPQNYNNDPSGYSPGTTAAALIDINGDGLPDWVTQPSSGTLNHFNVQTNSGSGFASVQSWQTVTEETSDGDPIWNDIDTRSGVDGSSPILSISSLMDMNGDLLPDRVVRQHNTSGGVFNHFQVQLNSGSGFNTRGNWTGLDSSHPYYDGGILNVPFVKSLDGEADLATLIDMNGDGLPDRVMIGSVNNQFEVQLNNTNGVFSGITPWGNVASSGNDYSYTPRNRDYSHVYSELMDMNGDGLPDRVLQNGVQLNTGAGSFLSAQTWNYSGDPEVVNVTAGAYTTKFIDMNGDGLPDKVVSHGSSTYTVYFNTGKGFSSTGVTWTGVNTAGDGTTGWSDLQSWGGYGTKTMFIDMNGDGLVDRVIRNYSGSGTSLQVQLNPGPFPDLLTGVDNGMGGTVFVTYTNSTHWNNSDGTRPRLPLPVQTVTSVTVGDGIRNWGTTTYSYVGGLYDTTWREFRGFAEVIETDPLGTITFNLFHQGGGLNLSNYGEYQDSRFKAGIPWDILVYDWNYQLYKETFSIVDQVRLDPNGVYFPYVTNVFTFDSEPSADTRATLRQFHYGVTPDSLTSSTGNLLQESELGEVTGVTTDGYGNTTYSDVSDPTVYTTYVYATLSNSSIIDKPSSVTISSDSAGNNVLRKTQYSYFGSTGNLQEKSELVCPSTYANTVYTYDNYGNPLTVTTVTDPMNLVTTMVYDADTATYLTRKNIGSLTNCFLYDPCSGSLLSSTNEQGLVTANGYDGLFRLTNSAVSTTPYGAATLWRQRYQYHLDGMNANGTLTYNYVHSVQNDPTSSTGYHESLTYLDGLGRSIQVLNQSETNGQYRAANIFYDQRGNVEAQSYPVFVSGSNYVMASGSPQIAWTTFDGIGRPDANYPCANASFDTFGDFTGGSNLNGDSGSPVGPVSVAYYDGSNPWAVVVTDARNKVHKYSLDAFGRTNQIVEVTAGGNLTTSLGYNQVGDLTNIIDSANNKIAMFYDLSGHQVALADPDMGFWQYNYDLAGRLKTQTDAKGQQIKFFYSDAAGRVTRREGWNAAGKCVSTNTWAYDSTSGDSSCTVYSGQLYKVADDEGWQKFSYDVRGRTVKSVRYLAKNSSTYTNQFTFDDADRLTSTIYPNGGPVITNIFDVGQHLLQVKQVAGTNFYTAKGFNELSQLNGVNFGNGAATTFGYFKVSKRLTKILTTAAGSTTIQSFTNRYDAVGNVVGLQDLVGSHTNSASATISSATYDDLNRLTAATWTGYGTKNYGYSAIGNVLTNSESGTTNYVYGSIRPHAVRTANGTWFTYDQNGNVLFRGAQRLDYDVNNHLSRVINTNGTITTFGYAGSGERLWEQSGTNALQVWIGNNYEEKSGQKLFHVYANGQTVCTFDKTGTNVYEYYHPDYLTSTSLQTDRSGNQIQHYEYSAFGQTRYTQSTNVFKVSRLYTGQILDDSTGLYYYNARYYDPILGRFTQPDDTIPDLFNPQSFNRYSYCVNNPLRFTDPSGHDFVTATAGDGNFGFVNGPVQYMTAKTIPGQIGAGLYNIFPSVDNTIHQALRGIGAVDNAAGNVLHDTTLAVTGDPQLAENSRNLTWLIGGVGEIGKISKVDELFVAAGKESKSIKEGIYTFKEGDAAYIGQSGNIPKRLKAHELSGKKAPGVDAKVSKVTGGKTEREIAEHKKIQETTGGIPASQSTKVTNKRDPIGPNRQNLLKDNP